MKIKEILLLIAIVFILSPFQSQTISPVSGFGTNPGSLNMYNYVPSGISGPAPLVIALHGCTQTAAEYAAQSGWNKLANLHKFYMAYAEQVSANNSEKCFNWFDTTQVNKNVGEDLSIKQMKDYMVAHYDVDTTRIFVTGLSAGAAMTVVMLATYPQTYTKGAVMAG
jgi:poly(hydroxyalkanoate) depolymerase family esterase